MYTLPNDNFKTKTCSNIIVGHPGSWKDVVGNIVKLESFKLERWNCSWKDLNLVGKIPILVGKVTL